MSRAHVPSAAAVAAAVAAAATTFFTLLAWDGLSDDASGYLVPLFWVCVGVAALGLALRWLRVPVPLVPVLQLLVVGLVLHRWWVPDAPVGGLVPTPESLRAILDLFRAGVEVAGDHPAPIPQGEAAFAPMMVAVGALVAVCVDALACSLRRVPLAGLPLLAVFTVPVAIVDGVPWPAFALAATCFLLLLSADQAARLGGWGTNLGRTAPERGAGPVRREQQVRLGTVWPTATRLGLVGIGLAVVAPLLVPATDGLLDSDDGPGGSGGGDEVRVDNPFVDMRRDLNRDIDVDLVRVRTDDPAPAYLRMTALDEFDGERWTQGERDYPESNQADGPFPEPRGLDGDVPRTRNRWDLTLTQGFNTSWLPMPYPAAEVDVEGDWRYDDQTLDVMLNDAGLDTAGLSYSVDGLVLEPVVTDLVSAPGPPLSISTPNTRLPEDTPPWIEDLAVDVTDGASSQFERAVRLQEWFRRDGGFTYSLARGSGSGLEQLELFLGTGPGSRTGYCEQFAASMTMMARTLGIPARIAVGFLRPDGPESDGSYVFSYHDLHAWPELYFEGAGWVRFEPTPQRRAPQVPEYTTGEVPAPPEVPSTSPSPTAEQSPSPTAAPETDADAAAADGTGGIPAWLAAIPAGALVVALAWTPRWVRAALRRRRYAGPGGSVVAEGCWAEVRATALDLGLGWDDGATLRTRATAIAAWLRSAAVSRSADAPVADPEPAVRALEGLVLAVERSRYSRQGLPAEVASSLPALTSRVTGAMQDASPPRARRRAEWLPASLWGGRASVRSAPDGEASTSAGPGQGRDRVSV